MFKTIWIMHFPNSNSLHVLTNFQMLSQYKLYCSTLYHFWKYIDAPYKVDTATSPISSSILSAEKNLYLIPNKSIFLAVIWKH